MISAPRRRRDREVVEVVERSKCSVWKEMSEKVKLSRRYRQECIKMNDR